MQNDAKVLRKYVEILKDFSFVIVLLFGLFGAWQSLQEDVKTSQILIQQIQKENAELSGKIDQLSKVIVDHETNLKVIDTQLKIMKGQQ